ncbi:MAG: DUF6194 family protein [Nocardioides sp.]|nr:DUF6194 family protein [Nocardioides sp.]
MRELLETVRAFDGLLELSPTEGSEYPEIAWGDHFFYYAPDGVVPNGPPYATIVTKHYPGEPPSSLDPADRWRVNIHVGTTTFTELTGEDPRHIATRDFTVADVILPHPVYGSLGWIAVVNPAQHTAPVVVELLRTAHEAAKRRAVRRSAKPPVP